MSLGAQLSVITPVSRPDQLAVLGACIPPEAEWLLVTDGPREIPAGLRAHTLIEGPATGRWGDAQRQVGLQAATREFVYFLDDDNLMAPQLPDLVLPHLRRTGAAGLLFGVLLHHPGGFYIWPPPVRVERSQVDTAMFIGRTEVAQQVGWPDLTPDDWPDLAGQRCGDYVFISTFDEQAGLGRLPAIYGFQNGHASLRTREPEVFAALERGEDAAEAILGVLQRHMTQADAPPWWKGERARAAVPAAPGAGAVTGELLELAGTGSEGSSVPAQRAHLARLAAALVADRPGQPVNVMEVGFNAGLGAAAFLEASPQVHVVSCDLAEDPHVMPCAELLRTRFPGRFHLVIGDSRDTLRRFAAAAGARFDLIVIDGGHTEEICHADVSNARALAAPGAVVVVDDLMPHKVYGVGVSAAWEALLRDGVLTGAEIWCALPGAVAAVPDTGGPPERCERRWGIARFG